MLASARLRRDDAMRSSTARRLGSSELAGRRLGRINVWTSLLGLGMNGSSDVANARRDRGRGDPGGRGLARDPAANPGLEIGFEHLFEYLRKVAGPCDTRQAV